MNRFFQSKSNHLNIHLFYSQYHSLWILFCKRNISDIKKVFIEYDHCSNHKFKIKKNTLRHDRKYCNIKKNCFSSIASHPLSEFSYENELDNEAYQMKPIQPNQNELLSNKNIDTTNDDSIVSETYLKSLNERLLSDLPIPIITIKSLAKYFYYSFPKFGKNDLISMTCFRLLYYIRKNNLFNLLDSESLNLLLFAYLFQTSNVTRAQFLIYLSQYNLLNENANDEHHLLSTSSLQINQEWLKQFTCKDIHPLIQWTVQKLDSNILPQFIDNLLKIMVFWLDRVNPFPFYQLLLLLKRKGIQITPSCYDHALRQLVKSNNAMAINFFEKMKLSNMASQHTYIYILSFYFNNKTSNRIKLILEEYISHYKDNIEALKLAFKQCLYNKDTENAFKFVEMIRNSSQYNESVERDLEFNTFRLLLLLPTIQAKIFLKRFLCTANDSTDFIWPNYYENYSIFLKIYDKAGYEELNHLIKKIPVTNNLENVHDFLPSLLCSTLHYEESERISLLTSIINLFNIPIISPAKALDTNVELKSLSSIILPKDPLVASVMSFVENHKITFSQNYPISLLSYIQHNIRDINLYFNVVEALFSNNLMYHLVHKKMISIFIVILCLHNEWNFLIEFLNLCHSQASPDSISQIKKMNGFWFKNDDDPGVIIFSSYSKILDLITDLKEKNIYSDRMSVHELTSNMDTKYKESFNFIISRLQVATVGQLRKRFDLMESDFFLKEYVEPDLKEWIREQITIPPMLLTLQKNLESKVSQMKNRKLYMLYSS